MASNESVILTWNVPNWITVILMGATGFALIGFLQKLIAKQRASKAAAQ